MPRIEAIVFDLDDTLYPERDFALSGFRAVASAFQSLLGDATQTEADLRRLFDTKMRPRVFDALMAERGLPQESALIAQMVETYRQHRPTISLYPDADMALKRMAPAFRLGLLTDGPMITQRNKVAALGLADRFDALVYTAELGSDMGKPHPAGFELLSRQLGVVHQRCVYVADNPAKDFVAPNALGWMSIRVLRPDGVYARENAAQEGEPTATIDTLDQLDRLVN